jgi:hypothetical protein
MASQLHVELQHPRCQHIVILVKRLPFSTAFTTRVTICVATDAEHAALRELRLTGRVMLIRFRWPDSSLRPSCFPISRMILQTRNAHAGDEKQWFFDDDASTAQHC